MGNMKTADDALREINENFMKLDEHDIAKSNQIVDYLKNDVVSNNILTITLTYILKTFCNNII